MNQPPRIIVDRDRFRLYLYRWSSKVNRFRRVKTYKIAVGAVGTATPPGPYVVMGKSTEPDWHDPSGPADAKSIPYEDLRNPFKGGFISLGGHPSTQGDGIGLHGTKFPPKIGTRASHGCVRMRTQDFLDLYDRVPVGMAVDVV